MPLFWIVHRVNGEPRVYITEASSPIYARLEGAKAGILNPADFVEMHALDDTTTRKIPQTMRGRLLTQEEFSRGWIAWRRDRTRGSRENRDGRDRCIGTGLNRSRFRV